MCCRITVRGRGKGTGDWGQLVLVVIHKDAKSFHKQNTFFSVFLRRIARATELRCGGGGVAGYTTRGRSVCVCVCVSVFGIPCNNINNERNTTMYDEVFSKIQFPLSFSHSLCLSHTLLPFLVRPAQNFKIPAHSRFHVIVVVVAFFASYK